MPFPLAGAGVEGDQAGAEEIVAGAEAAVVVDGGAIGGDVDDVRLHIGGDWRPGGHVAGPLPGVVFPGFVAVFAGAGDDVELPLEIAGGLVVAEDVAGDVLYAGLVVALLGGVAHHHGVVDDDGRRG